MTLALPWAFGLAVAAALAVTALHLLSVRRPPELLLPTMRFLPDRDVRAVSRTRRPSDPWLLALRVLLLLLAGLAVAQPRWTSRARTGVRLVVVGPGIVRDTAAITARVRSASRRPDDAGLRLELVYADSAMDGGVTALFPLAMRAAAAAAQRDESVDSIELHLLTAEPRVDGDALAAWRAAWSGRVVVHAPPVDGRVADTRGRVIVLVNEEDQILRIDAPTVANDGVLAALWWHAQRSGQAATEGGAVAVDVRADTVRVLRRAPVPADAAGEETRVSTPGATRSLRLIWPSDGKPAGWQVSGTPDSADAIATNGRALAGPWMVAAAPRSGDRARAIAWWSDGRIAATETRTDAGCDRRISLISPRAGDALLSSSADALFARLLAPCMPSASAVATALRTLPPALSTDGLPVADEPLAGAAVYRGAMSDVTSTRTIPRVATVVLLALALLLLVAEWRLRDRTRGIVA